MKEHYVFHLIQWRDREEQNLTYTDRELQLDVKNISDYGLYY